jgi:hypothetical protein
MLREKRGEGIRLREKWQRRGGTTQRKGTVAGTEAHPRAWQETQ